ncbi:NACHT domain-containing protein [Streptomyces sp. KM273126]|uniref:NACHT domain-containing protein n=1 Tax=Streptomyces sp. KM273126 TaxID=2545247 RepID=UPI00103A291F|nr:NACHT domain-containing protein [Streptomyces sp. KM273126]MBA2813889.1 NACHT domain-containing protein [Streptomyces sp. KM273126]
MTREVRNVFSGTAHYVIQAGEISGDIHVHAAPDTTPLDRVAGELASLVHAQWRDEAALRGLGGSAGLSVPWQADWSIADHRGKAGAQVPGRGDGLPELATAFRALPQRRLVVLGPPGSGKSSLAVLLALELLRERGTHDPVPVILLLTTWDPAKQHLDAWLADRIAEDYAGRAPGLDRRSVRRLVRDRRVLPVLEGLDELPESRRAAALTGLNRALGQGDSVVLTSRSAEYAAAAGSERVVDSAAVIEALPVPTEAVLAHLRAMVHPRRLPLWQRVFDDMAADPRGPVASVLSSPLILWLATQVYAGPATRPEELTDRHRFPSATAIEEHLLEGLVPAVFTYGPASPDQVRPVRQWDPRSADLWLRFFAAHLDRLHTRDLAWWRLRGPSSRTAMSKFTLVLGALPALALGVGAGYLATAVLAGRAQDVVTVLRLCVAALLAVILGLVGGKIAEALHRTGGGQPRRPARPTAVVVSAAVLVPSLTAVMAMGAEHPFVLRLGALLPLALGVVLTRPVDSDAPVGPDTLLRGERRVALVSALVIAPALAGLTVSYLRASNETAVLTGMALTTWLLAAAGLVATSRWGRWTTARTVLALCSRLPWSVTVFLRDAHRLGILRQVGGVYQFRHARLQQRLGGQEANDWEAERQETAREVRVSGASSVAVTIGPTTFVGPWLGGALCTYFAVTERPVLWWFAVFLIALPPLLWLAARRVPRHEIELRLDEELIEIIGHEPFSLRWLDVEQVSVRALGAFGRDGHAYGIQVRLAPDRVPPPGRTPDRDGWITIWGLGDKPGVPPEIATALSRWGGARWNGLA